MRLSPLHSPILHRLTIWLLLAALLPVLQERVIKEGSAAMSELQATIAEVTTENERLLAEVTRQMELLAKHASAQGPDNGDAGGHVPPLPQPPLQTSHSAVFAVPLTANWRSRETLERLDLLTQENQLLTQQQSELETEIARLTGFGPVPLRVLPIVPLRELGPCVVAGRMEERTRDHIKMAQESSQLGAKLRAAQTRLAEAEGRAERYRTAARHEGERADPLHQRSGREQVAEPCALSPPCHPPSKGCPVSSACCGSCRGASLC